MICRCKLECFYEANGSGETPEQKELCDACYLDWDLGGGCGLPPTPTPEAAPLEPLVPIADKDKNDAIEKGVTEEIG